MALWAVAKTIQQAMNPNKQENGRTWNLVCMKELSWKKMKKCGDDSHWA
jgi:hypothetical protein